jgi:hypothetical protein
MALTLSDPTLSTVRVSNLYGVPFPDRAALPTMPSLQRLLDWHCDRQSCQRRLAPRLARLLADFATRRNACMHIGVAYALPGSPR